MPDFQDHCTVRPDLPGHGTTRVTDFVTFKCFIQSIQAAPPFHKHCLQIGMGQNRSDDLGNIFLTKAFL